MKVQCFVFNPIMENTYVLYDDTKECIIVDPGCYEHEEQEELTNFIEDNNLIVKELINTHCHVDHVLGNAFVKRVYKVPLRIHELEDQQLRAVKVYAPHYGFFQYEETNADGFIKEGDVVKFGNQELQVLFVPGHSPGHIALWNASTRQLIAGDVLFDGSIGRTDLPGGDYDTLIQSIHRKFFTLPDDVTVYCGHGSETSIGVEKRTNPFCALFN